MAILLFSVTPWLPLGLPLLALAGFGYLGSNTSATTRLALGVVLDLLSYSGRRAQKMYRQRSVSY